MAWEDLATEAESLQQVADVRGPWSALVDFNWTVKGSTVIAGRASLGGPDERGQAYAVRGNPELCDQAGCLSKIQTPESSKKSLSVLI